MTNPTPIRATMIDTRDLKRTFKSRGGTVEAVARRRPPRRARARSSASSARTGRARPPPCGCSRRSSARPPARPPWPAPISAASRSLVRQRIGYVPQGGSTDPAETGRGELVIQGRLYGMNGSDAKARAAEVLAALDLEAAADRATGTYSGGMRRRLDVGLGIVHRPQVLFLDEPTTGLDPQARARMWDEIRNLRELGTTVFLTTHYLEEADALCDRLAIIDHGQDRGRGHVRPAQAEGRRRRRDDRRRTGPAPRSSAWSRPCRSSARPRTTTETGLVRLYVDRGETAVPQLLRSLDAAGFAPTSISLNKPSLDDVFLRQTGPLPARGGGMTATAAAPVVTTPSIERTPRMRAAPRHLADLPPVARS